MTATHGSSSATSYINPKLRKLAARTLLPAAVIAFWTVVAIQSIAWRFYIVQSRPGPAVPLGFIARAEVIVFSIAAACTPSIIRMARRYPLGRTRWLRVGIAHLLGGAVFALTIKFLWDLAILPFYYTPWVKHFSWNVFLQSVFAGFQTNAILYWVVVIGITAIDHARRYHQTALEAAELRSQLAEAQLATLRSQLDPHFLFNTLHSISELVHEDPDTADLMIVNLSELLRQSLATSDRHEITLERELEFLRLYVDIQCCRFRRRLTVRFEIGPAVSAALVPGMLLQPLVENSILHAISPRRTGGCVVIRADRAGDDLLLEVEDFGGRPAVVPVTEGVGLRNSRRRLAGMYPDRHEFELLAGSEGLRVRVRLPFSEESHAAA
jgi:two-component sensor histidine kinase